MFSQLWFSPWRYSCATVWADPAFAERRVALVIGNSAYQNAPVLPNPAKDAKAIAAMFVKAGYDVVSAQYDVGNLDFKRAIRQFEDAVTDADIAVIYYAGHGLELHGTNYLIPVDAQAQERPRRRRRGNHSRAAHRIRRRGKEAAPHYSRCLP